LALLFSYFFYKVVYLKREPNFFSFVNHNRYFKDFLKVLLSHDDRGFLGWYKKYNPEGTIIALDLGKPSYLSEKDFILKGDIQEVIPALEKAIIIKVKNNL